MTLFKNVVLTAHSTFKLYVAEQFATILSKWSNILIAKINTSMLKWHISKSSVVWNNHLLRRKQWSKSLLVIRRMLPEYYQWSCSYHSKMSIINYCQKQHHLPIHRIFPTTASLFLTSISLLVWKEITTLIYSKMCFLWVIKVFVSICSFNCLISTAVSTGEDTCILRGQLDSSGWLCILIKNHSHQLQLKWSILW